ncbi:hypothetical protein BEWA_019830 [Theileria equi strain WA]|uniref:Uncharacterized protein n=1 Tax=Theileria equi strain WA TaxID=1537102 RepID=L0AU16_THEEQ|nr:hypothetical protein BEWA_019830 [Theileria equi strain WA]AFZ79137.1 hypothetical protein BEWA_019830 [Theileria equi strain WA]|eukprot:XP_004828803.1 hypothetical protein BEWA_019830 [Theileria equi strain WA]
MNLNDLSEDQKELLQPILRLKTDVSLDSLVILRDVFKDLSKTYNTFASSIKDIEKKVASCYNIASSGNVSQEACDALLSVRGDASNASDIILSVTAEQSGFLKVIQTLISTLNRMHDEGILLSTSLDNSVVNPLSSFAEEYLGAFGKDEKRTQRDDISSFIPNLQAFKRTPGYSHSRIRKYIDNVLKSYRDLQDCINYEKELNDKISSDKDNPVNTKTILKAKNRTIRAKVNLTRHIQELFTAAPELKDIVDLKNTDVDTLSKITKVSKKYADSSKKHENSSPKHIELSSRKSHFFGTAVEYHRNFYDLEQRRLELLSGCLQLWIDNHVKYKKGIYSQLEMLWNDISNFSPSRDFSQFEYTLTGTHTQEDSSHSRIWLPLEPGSIDDCKNTKLNTFSQISTPIYQSDNEDYQITDAHYAVVAENLLSDPDESNDISLVKTSQNFVNCENENTLSLIDTGKRLDQYMISLYNIFDVSLDRNVKFDWLDSNIENIIQLEHHDLYPFLIDGKNTKYISHNGFRPQLEYSFKDDHMDDEQWNLLTLELLLMIHSYISGFINHPSLSGETKDDLSTFLFANLGILEQLLIKIRTIIEVYRDKIGISTLSYSILDVVLKPRDTFSNWSPHVSIHIMDIRYRILLLIDSLSRSDIIQDKNIFDFPEFYMWMYRQLHIVRLSLVQKLARVIRRIPTHSKDIEQRWIAAISSCTPLKELAHRFTFKESHTIEEISNKILFSVSGCLGKINKLRNFTLVKLEGSHVEDIFNFDSIRQLLLDILEEMVLIQDLDEELSLFSEVGKLQNSEVNNDKILTPTDFCINMNIYNDEEISVLAEIRKKNSFCIKSCKPCTRYDPIGNLMKQVVNENLAIKFQRNLYFRKRIDPVLLSPYWTLEEPTVMLLSDCLHRALSCDEISFTDLPQRFQMIIYIISFVQTGILPNFNLLNPNVTNNENSTSSIPQLPVVSHSILASISYWFSKIVNEENDKDATETRKFDADISVDVKNDRKTTDDAFKRLRLSELGIRGSLIATMQNVKITEAMAKQLYLFFQLPNNLKYLPRGLGDLDAYLLFDLEKFKNGGNYDPEAILPEYTFIDRNCLELVSWSNLDQLSNSVTMQIQGMQLQKVHNKVHTLLATILNHNVPLNFNFKGEESFSILLPSKTERFVSSILSLRLLVSRFKNEIFTCLCKNLEFMEKNAFFFILSIFSMMYKVLFAEIDGSESCGNTTDIFNDDTGEATSITNIFRHIVLQNAKVLIMHCLDRVNDNSEPEVDSNTFISLLVDEMLQMLRHECTTNSHVWSNFLPFSEFPSLLSNCCMLQLKSLCMDNSVNIDLIMPNLRKLMVLQREFDVSYIMRSPSPDQSIQQERLLDCMFFMFRNKNHLRNGCMELVGLVKDSTIKVLDTKFIGINEIIQTSIDNDAWVPISEKSLHSTGAVDLIVVLHYSLHASFDLLVPVEWLILPFTNACEQAIRQYYTGITNIYNLKTLYNIHSIIYESDNGQESLVSEVTETDPADVDTRFTMTYEDSRGEVHGGFDKKIGRKGLLKNLKTSKNPSHNDLKQYIDQFSNTFIGKGILEDLVRIWNMDYVSLQLIKAPDEILGYFYNQVRQRDTDFSYIHKLIGTVHISDPNNFFFCKPHQLAELSHSKAQISLIFASQRIMKRDSNQYIRDVITVILWKWILVDFKQDLLNKLYVPNIANGLNASQVVDKFPHTILSFVQKMPQHHIEFALTTVFEILIKIVLYILKHMKIKGYKFSSSDINVLNNDLDTLQNLLISYSQDEKLLSQIKIFVRKIPVNF